MRVTLTVKLVTARIPLQVDTRFGDAITPGPRLETIPTLLDFPAPRVLTYAAETVIAEKFQAMVSLGTASTRLKDFFDVWTHADRQEFDGTARRRSRRHSSGVKPRFPAERRSR